MKKKQSLILDQKHPHLLQYSSQKRKKKTTGLWGCLHIAVHSLKNNPEKWKAAFSWTSKNWRKTNPIVNLFCFSEIAEEVLFLSEPTQCDAYLPTPRPVLYAKIVTFLSVCVSWKMRVWSALFCLHCRDIIVE